MKILFRNTQAIRLDFTALLLARGIAKTDIAEATFMVKLKANELDTEAVIDLRLGAGLEWDIEEDKLLATIPQDQWDNVSDNANYLFGVGFKEVGDTAFTEATLGNDSFTVYPDFIRE